MKNRIVQALLTALLISSMIVSPVFATTLEDMQKNKDQAETEASSLQEQLTQTLDKIDTLEADLDKKQEEVFRPYLVRVEISDLNIRKKPGTDQEKVGYFTGVGCFTIVAEADGVGASKWGLLKAYEKERNGWISLDFVTRI